MPIFPDCYDEWSLNYGSNTLFEGTADACREFAHRNFTDEEIATMFLMDWEGREWDV